MKTVKRFKELWEQIEKANLTNDREHKLKQLEQDKEYLDNEAMKVADEEDKYVEEQILARDDITDEDKKDLESKKTRLIFQAQKISEGEKWKKMLIEDLPKTNVLKQGRILQSVFYILGYEREVICERKTNKLWWKLAKKQISEEFLKKLLNY